MLRFQDMSNLSICSLSIFAVTVIVFPVGKIAIYIFERCHQLNMFFKTECQTSAIEIQSKHLVGRSCMIYQPPPPTPPQKKNSTWYLRSKRVMPGVWSAMDKET